MAGKEGGVPKKIILVGDVAVGKTSLILRFTEGTFDENTAATASFDFKTKPVAVGKKTQTLHIWDTAGQERFGTITSSVYRKAKGVAYVYDASREESFNNLTQWIEEVNRKYNEVQTSNVVIVANKTDLPSQVPVDVAQKFAQQHKATFIQACAKTGEGVDTIFTTLAAGLDEKAAGGSEDNKTPTRITGRAEKGEDKGDKGGKKKCIIL